jgi:mRNA interferase MazF
MVKRGEVWLCALDPTVGSEIQKTRPCVVVSPDELNDRLRTVIVAPMTTGSRPAPFRVPVTFQAKAGLILPDQMRAVDRDRLIKRRGLVDAGTMSILLGKIAELFS